jgi:hypothetical protein
MGFPSFRKVRYLSSKIKLDIVIVNSELFPTVLFFQTVSILAASFAGSNLILVVDEHLIRNKKEIIVKKLISFFIP